MSINRKLPSSTRAGPSSFSNPRTMYEPTRSPIISRISPPIVKPRRRASFSVITTERSSVRISRNFCVVMSVAVSCGDKPLGLPIASPATSSSL